jgi:hypothetical protein
MEETATSFWKKHRGQGRVVKVTPYCFWWEEIEKKNPFKVDSQHIPVNKTKTTVYMASYFL